MGSCFFYTKNDKEEQGLWKSFGVWCRWFLQELARSSRCLAASDLKICEGCADMWDSHCKGIKSIGSYSGL